MPKIFKKIHLLWILSLLCFSLAFFIFQNNFLGFVQNNDHFRKFDVFSEALIVGKIVADERGIDTEQVNLVFISEGTVKKTDITTEGYRILQDDSVPTEKLQFFPYISQYGLQGRVYSALYRQLGLRLDHFKAINSLLLTLTFFALYLCYSRLFDRKYAIIFLIVSISSPWVVIFARSFYWVPFTWYLPTLFTALAYLAKRKTVFYLLVFFSFFVKSLAGYEYISSVTLMACSIPLIAPYFRGRSVNWRHQTGQASIIFLLCVGGFLAAFLTHATTLSDSNIFAGIQSIVRTAARRTIGNEALSRHPSGQAAIEASPLSIIDRYITHWDTSVFLGIPGKWFAILFVLSLVGLSLKLIFRSTNCKKHWVLFLVSLSVPVSWFGLAKTHSYFHFHLNYVLWYLSFIPAMVYVLSDDLAYLVRQSYKVAKGIRSKYLRLR